MAITNPNPLFDSQWYLKNTGQRGNAGIDINVTPVWADYTGKGVIVAVNDDGMDLTHPDLVGNILADKVFDSVRGTTGSGFGAPTATDNNEHGTVVGSIIAMVNNTIGGVGVAYEAKLVPGTYSGGADKAFLANLASGAWISCNSWGSDPAFSDNPGANGTPQNQALAAALLQCVTEARGGLGMVIEVSAGNERGNKADAGMVHFNSARYIISVGAVDDQGKATDYSTPGASLLVTAPGGVGGPPQSENSGYGIVSADIQGITGYNKTAGADGDYAYQNQGTSYSGPMVAGVAALMLQANTGLGFRDVSDILAMTARKNDLASPSWVATKGGNWNMTDMHFSRDFGFGLLDATAAVHLAESWTAPANTVANWVSKDAVSTAATATIPESGALTIAAAMADNIRIDRVEVLLDLGAALPSQLKATLTSPGGTTVTLFDQPLSRSLENGAPDTSIAETAWPGVFTVGVTAFLGETSQGTWTIKLEDTVAGTTATYNSATVRAWGSNITADDNLVFTNEFIGSKTLTDTAGSDTLNAAAVSTAVTLDLRANAKSTIATGEVTLAGGTVIENAIGGSGNDTLIGNDGDNTLRGNRGDDNIIGGAGIDTAVYRGKDTDYTVTTTANGFTVTSINGLTEGTDTLTGIEKLKFSNLTRDLTPAAPPTTLGSTDDFVVLQPTTSAIAGAGVGNDTYLLSGSMVPAGKAITISDAVGTNTLQLAPGLSVASSQVSATALKLTLTNGASLTVLGADKFGYDVGGNLSAGLNPADLSFSQFVQNTLGTTIPTTGLGNGGAFSVGSGPVASLLASTASGDDFIVAQVASSAIIGAGAGNDTYFLAPDLLPAGTNLTISDALGSNSIQLASGLQIASAQVAATALKLNLTSGASITVLGADRFTFEAGGNTSAGIDQADLAYSQFVQNVLGTSLPTTGFGTSGPVTIGGSSAGASAINVSGNQVFNATAAADVFSFNAVSALLDAAGTNTQATISGFSTANDRLVIDLVTANSSLTRLDQLSGVQGISVATDPFTGTTLVNFGNDASGGQPVTLSLLGVSDPAAVQIQVV
jgi:subtilisin-like proprotein convertase family protein